MFPYFVAPSANRQHGAVVIMTVGFMLLAVLFLALAVDTGRLYLDKRKLQRVADVAALEAVTQNGVCRALEEGETDAQATAVSSAQRNSFIIGDGRTVLAECGDITSVDGVRIFTVNNSSMNAIRVTVTESTPASIIAGGVFGNDIVLRAEATASRGSNTLASLTIRSNLVTLDTSVSPLLDPVLGGLLGTNLSLTGVGWQGLLGTEVQLLGFLDALATELNLDVGGYDEVLATELTVGQLASLTATALRRANQDFATGANGTTLDLASTLFGLDALASSISPTTISLGELLNIGTGADSGADVNLNLFDLVTSSIQLAAGDSVANVSLPIGIPGIAGATLKVKVVEPQQLSAVGNPHTDDIFVRTSQVRLLLKLDLSGTVGVANGLLDAISFAYSPLVDFASANFTGLGLLGAVGNALTSIIGGLACPLLSPCPVRNIVYADTGKLEIGLDVGAGNARITGHECRSDKLLDVDATSELGHIYLGLIDEAQFFASGALVNVDPNPAPVIELGYKKARPSSCVLGFCSDLRWEQPGGSFLLGTAPNSAAYKSARRWVLAGVGAKANEPIGNTTRKIEFFDPEEVGLPPSVFEDVAAEKLVGSLQSTLLGVDLKAYNSSGGTLGTVLSSSFGLLNGLVGSVAGLLGNVLGPLLDPIVDGLLRSLGVSLAGVQVGSNLSCGDDSSAILVR